MTFLYNKHSHFNLANMLTMGNIACGVMALIFLSNELFFFAALFAWVGGAFDIADGKVARKYNLSTEFGVQIDSFADSLSFVVVPVLFIYFAVIMPANSMFLLVLSAPVMAYYIICGLRRLSIFNINTDAGEADKFFTGVPTPMGAILLWLTYLGHAFAFYSSEYVALLCMVVIGFLLNSKVQIPHP